MQKGTLFRVAGKGSDLVAGWQPHKFLTGVVEKNKAGEMSDETYANRQPFGGGFIDMNKLPRTT